MNDDRERVRDANPIEDIVGDWVDLKPAGRTLKGLCPFHREKTPSFNVDSTRGTYRCFGCQEHGDVFSFVMKMEGLDFREALERLAERAHIQLTSQPSSMSGGPSRTQRRADDYALLARVSEWFRKNLSSTGGRAALQYLEARGIFGETAERFAVGYAPDEWQALTTVLEKNGHADRALELGVLRRSPGGRLYDTFRGRVMFPIRDTTGRTVGFGGRTLPDAKTDSKAESGESHAGSEANSARAKATPPPKYINSTESDVFHKGKLLFGQFEGRDEIRRTRSLLVMEGYTDVILAHREGFQAAVASLGTAFTDQNVENLRRYADRVCFVFDGDAAGRGAARKAVEMTLNESLDIEVVLLPDGVDPAELLTGSNGAESFRQVLEGARPALSFLIENSAVEIFGSSSGATGDGRRSSRDNAAKRERFARSIHETLRSVDSALAKRRAAELVAEELSVSPTLIVGEFSRWDRESGSPKLRRNVPKAQPRPKRADAGSVEERAVLRACLEWPEHLLRLLGLRQPDVFADSRCRALATVMEERAGPVDALEIEELDLRNLVVEIQDLDPPSEDWLRHWLHGHVIERAQQNAQLLNRAREQHAVFEAGVERRDYDALFAQEIELRAEIDRLRSQPLLDLSSLIERADQQLGLTEELQEEYVESRELVQAPSETDPPLREMNWK